jgi:hypothetical protein
MSEMARPPPSAAAAPWIPASAGMTGWSGRGDDGRPAAAYEADVQDLPRDRRAEAGREIERVHSRIAANMELASAESSARPPLDRAQTVLGSPITAPSRVKLTRTVT